MTRHARRLEGSPIAVSAKSAAALLDMSHAKFCELVRSGALPTSKMIGDLERWEVQEIRAIISGDARQPAEDIEL